MKKLLRLIKEGPANKLAGYFTPSFFTRPDVKPSQAQSEIPETALILDKPHPAIAFALRSLQQRNAIKPVTSNELKTRLSTAVVAAPIKQFLDEPDTRPKQRPLRITQKEPAYSTPSSLLTTNTQTNGLNHVVAIPTYNRPGSLRRCVSSLVENMQHFNYKRKIKVVIVDDSNQQAAIKENQKILAELKRKHGDKLEIHYYDKKDQAELLKSLEGQLPIDPQKLVYSDPKTMKKGIGGVRNLLTLFSLKHASGDDVVTFLDDDTSLKNIFLTERNGVKTPTYGHTANFFSSLDHVFKNKQVNVAGGLVTRDILESLELIPMYLTRANILFDHAKDKSPSELLAETGHAMTTVSGLGSEMQFGKAVPLFAKFSEDVVRRGRYPLKVRYYNPHQPLIDLDKPNDWLGGANVSVRASALANGVPYPTEGLRGEDITWSKLMQRKVGGVYRINLPVSHFKAGDRDIFKEHAQANAYLPVDQVLLQVGKNSSLPALAADLKRKAQTTNFDATLRNMRSELVQDITNWKIKAHAARRKINDPTAWWNQNPNNIHGRAARQLDQHLSIFESNEPQKIITELPQANQVKESLLGYADLMQSWQNALSKVREPQRQAA